MSDVRVVVVDDHEIIAQTLAAALTGEGFTVLRVTPDEDDLLDRLRAEPSHVVLLDLDLGGAGDGGELIEPLVDAGVTVLVLTGVTDRFRRARCLRAGATAVVSKHDGFDELRDAVAAAARGEELLPRHERDEELRYLRATEAARRERAERFEALTPREEEVLAALVEGQPVDEIARTAVVATSTVRSQVQAILRKLGVSSQLAAVARAREAEWRPSA